MSQIGGQPWRRAIPLPFFTSKHFVKNVRSKRDIKIMSKSYVQNLTFQSEVKKLCPKVMNTNRNLCILQVLTCDMVWVGVCIWQIWGNILLNVVATMVHIIKSQKSLQVSIQSFLVKFPNIHYFIYNCFCLSPMVFRGNRE